LATCESGGYRVERAGDFAVAVAEKTYEGCATCRGTGLIPRQRVSNGRTYEVASACDRRLLADRLTLFNAAQIPAKHGNASIKNFNVGRAKQDEAKRRATEFIHGWPNVQGLVLSGPPGTGKTHLLCGILREMTIERGVRAAYVEMSLLFATIRRGFHEGRSGGEIIGPLSRMELLAIDELGKGRGSPFELDTLDELIARRYNAGRITLFGTNYSLVSSEQRNPQILPGYEDPAAATKDSRLLCDRVGQRIYSRLTEMCKFVEFPPETQDERRRMGELRR
jgi:DNA replication protein DnaC